MQQALPGVFLVLLSISLVLSIATLIFSAIEFHSMRPMAIADIVIATVTIIYHACILAIFPIRLSPLNVNESRYSLKLSSALSISSAYFLFSVWIIIFGTSAQKTVNSGSTSLAVHVTLSVLTGVETIIMGIIAMYCTVSRRRVHMQAGIDEKAMYGTRGSLVFPPPPTSPPQAERRTTFEILSPSSAHLEPERIMVS